MFNISLAEQRGYRGVTCVGYYCIEPNIFLREIMLLPIKDRVLSMAKDYSLSRSDVISLLILPSTFLLTLTNNDKEQDMPIELATIASGHNTDKINNNFAILETVINEDILKRTGDDNIMETFIDMNGNSITNVAYAVNPEDAVPLKQLLEILGMA